MTLSKTNLNGKIASQNIKRDLLVETLTQLQYCSEEATIFLL